MRTNNSKVVAALLAAGLTSGGLVAGAGPAGAQDAGNVLVYGLTELDEIVTFRAGSPGTLVSGPTPLPRANGVYDVEAIDVRPATGQLYALYHFLEDEGGTPRDEYLLVEINTETLAAGSVKFLGPLEGDEFGFDFDPTTDRVRIVSNTGAQYLVAPDSRSRIDPADVTRTDSEPVDVRAVAYTDNVATETATTTPTTTPYLIDIEGPDALLRPSGTSQSLFEPVGTTGTDVATATATVTVASSPGYSVVQGRGVGFDIEAGTDAAFAVLEDPEEADVFHRVDLATGVATPVGEIGDRTVDVQDIAVVSPRISAPATAAGTEGGSVTLTFTRSGDTVDPVTVPFVVAGDVESADYTASDTAVRFAAGARTATLTLALSQDQDTSENETLELRLQQPSAPVNASVTRDFSTTVTITDAAAPSTGGGGGTAPDPAPTSPSPSPTPTPTPTPTTTPAAPRPSTPLSLDVADGTIVPTEEGVITVRGQAGAAIELLAYSRPSIQYGVVRTGTLDANGTAVFEILPGTNTRLYARYTGFPDTDSPSIVQNVATALSLSAVRNGSLDYTFQGRILPRRAGQLITLYRVEADGDEIITSQVRTDSTGTWRIRRQFVGQGIFPFIARTGQNLTNVAGASNTRPTAIYAGPQR